MQINSPARWLILIGLMLAWSLPGCERRKNASNVALSQAPATSAGAAVMSAASAAPATTQAAPSFIWIDAQPYQFPPARIVLKSSGDQLLALLFSNDPPSAISENYQGNSFYFEIPPEMADTSTLDGAAWDYKAPNSDRVDTLSGIFLEGRRKHLQPFDVHADFSGTASPLTVRLSGTFLQFDAQDDRMAGKLVTVKAELSAPLHAKSAPH